jgi:hypothetical protein
MKFSQAKVGAPVKLSKEGRDYISELEKQVRVFPPFDYAHVVGFVYLHDTETYIIIEHFSDIHQPRGHRSQWPARMLELITED